MPTESMAATPTEPTLTDSNCNKTNSSSNNNSKPKYLMPTDANLRANSCYDDNINSDNKYKFVMS